MFTFPHVRYISDPKSIDRKLYYLGDEPEDNHCLLTIGEEYRVCSSLCSDSENGENKRIFVCCLVDTYNIICRHVSLENFGTINDLRDMKIESVLDSTDSVGAVLPKINVSMEETFMNIYDITLITAINGDDIESLEWQSKKNKWQIMESKAILFSEQEKVFRERTGKDFSTLYKKYYPKLVYFTSKICNDTQKAEDISTDSFLAAFDKIDKYEKDKSQFSTWLFTIAKNLALQDKKNERRTMSLDIEFDEDGTTMKDFIQEEESDAYIHEVYAKKAEIMKKHIESLKTPYKEVIEMREIKKMSYKDISDKLGKNLSTIKSQIRNGRAILVEKTSREFSIIDDMDMDIDVSRKSHVTKETREVSISI